MNIYLLTLLMLPALCAILILLVPARINSLRSAVSLIATGLNLAAAIALFGQCFLISIPWLPFGIDFALRIDHFSTFIVLAVSGFSFLITLYSVVFFKGKALGKPFFAYLLLSVSMVNGATLADNLILMLFFWEGLLGVMFGFIAIGRPDAYKTAVKAVVLVGVSDLCMMLGIGLTGHLAGTFTISELSLPITGISSVAFILLMVGATSKAGSMPFHSWIPDAAIDAPTPFMAFLPASLEKLLGIYFLGRLTLQIFQLTPESWLSPLMMIMGGATLLLSAMMGLVQTDYKKLLSYCAISQVGYMILGIGTAVPVGIVGGLFHMINHATYKSCLFLTAGSVEKQAGTTELQKLGGLGRQMPVTFACFLVAAAAVSGLPPFNGFFSKELIYDGALERGIPYLVLVVLGSFFTTASFLKLGHSAFLGKADTVNGKVREASLFMLFPMIIIASVCILFGVYNALPINHLIQPILGAEKLEGHSFAGLPQNAVLVIVSSIVLVIAIISHLFGAKRSGSGLGAADHIRFAPVLSSIYDKAEKQWFDPYHLGLKVIGFFSRIGFVLERIIDWIYDGLVVGIVSAFSRLFSRWHNGNYTTYLLWSILGIVAVVVYSLVVK